MELQGCGNEVQSWSRIKCLIILNKRSQKMYYPIVLDGYRGLHGAGWLEEKLMALQISYNGVVNS